MQASPVSPLMLDAHLKLYKYNKLALERIRSSKYKGTTAMELWEYLNKSLPSESPISKASVIDGLNKLVDSGFIHFTKRPSHDSYLKVYYPNDNWKETSTVRIIGNDPLK